MFTRLDSSALMPCLDSLDLDEQAPNKRLKLAARLSKESLCC